MSKPRQQKSGFSNTHKNKETNEKPVQNSPTNITKGKLAIELINQGKLKEAEAIYRELISAGISNHIIYGNLAALCVMQDGCEEPIKLLHNALKLEPNFPKALISLGIALKKKGKLNAAISSYNIALQLKPNDAEAQYNLGNSLLEKGDLNAAISSYNIALQLKPNHPETHYNLGNALQKQGDLNNAINSYNIALQLKPNYLEAHINLGNSLLEKGDLNAAISSYNIALQLKPNHPETHYNLGNALQKKGDLNNAISSYNAALQLKPNYPEAHYNLGNALQKKGDLNASLSNHKRAVLIDPKNSNSFYGIGRIQAAKGDLKGSKNSFYKANDLDPNNTAALFELSKNISTDGDSQKLLTQLNGVTSNNLNLIDKSYLEFALANFYHESKDYINAMRHLMNANKLKLSLHPSDLRSQLLRTEQAADLARQIDKGNPNNGKGRIFIVGAPRCGSTLLESVLVTNPYVRELGESNALTEAFYQVKAAINSKEIAPSLLALYTKQAGEIPEKCTHSVDKNLYNFRFVAAIARAMPAAKVIHCRRHPLDNILSMLRSNLENGNNYTSDLTDAAKFLIHQEKTMNRSKRKYEKHIFTFDYDAFTSNPKKTISPLIDWLGLKWNERYLRPEANDRLINTASVIEARQPINSKSLGGWKNYRELLKPAEESLIESGIFNI
ncbi:tetratricopeptide repeat-containing sulfotransferase family protein [Synechococcus sp. MU1642]|uniref:tetratricopeptide repeat-containing sulfotransferase family protein n=1 Tax=Synechococcus sp. MU1642 TaxID=2508348 RepID=UPI001CF90567|nr:tetratricopeptide repeat-containing sulfotransferase family protein [Synechococcus sp. MU1642]MCB4407132.1 tetratricopeptide repeat protein [Synechococcus sp. MU1642]